jgi:vancomycin aglycone glucosyltransferase
MRVLLSTIGSRGDVQPLVGLALALRALGHAARVCAPPDFAGLIGDVGFDFVPLGPELRSFTASRAASASPPSSERLRQLADESVAAQFATVSEAAEGCDVLVAATALQIAARSVAEKRGMPYVFAAYCPIVLPSALHAPPPVPSSASSGSPSLDNAALWRQDAARFNALFGERLNGQRARLGLAPVDDVRDHIFGEMPWLACDPTLGPWPEPEDSPVFQPGAWLVRDERPLSPEVEAFLAAGEPPVYFGFGSIRATEGLSRVMIESARAVGRRAIVSRGWADLAAIDDAADCLVIGEVNQQALFARVAGTVHHGGAGTTTAAALAGVPQVLVPQMYDQRYWAARVQALGIGVAHAAGAPETSSLTEALVTALRPEVASAATRVAGEMRRDGAEVAARRLIADYA